MATPYFYVVHATENPDSKVIAKGKANDIMRKFELNSHNALSLCFKRGDSLIQKSYFIERIPLAEYNIRVAEERKRKKKKTAFDRRLEEIERMLDIHGNTIIFKDRDKVIDRLNRDGYFVKEIHEPRRVIKTKYLSRGRHEVYDECWILELIRKETIQNV